MSPSAAIISGSPIRSCATAALGPELRARRRCPPTSAAPAASCAAAQTLWEKPFLTGEANMSPHDRQSRASPFQICAVPPAGRRPRPFLRHRHPVVRRRGQHARRATCSRSKPTRSSCRSSMPVRTHAKSGRRSQRSLTRAKQAVYSGSCSCPDTEKSPLDRRQRPYPAGRRRRTRHISPRRMRMSPAWVTMLRSRGCRSKATVCSPRARWTRLEAAQRADRRARHVGEGSGKAARLHRPRALPLLVTLTGRVDGLARARSAASAGSGRCS